MAFQILGCRVSMVGMGSKVGILLERPVHNIMNHTQLLCSFQNDKDLKLKIEMACNHYTNFMVSSHI